MILTVTGFALTPQTTRAQSNFSGTGSAIGAGISAITESWINSFAATVGNLILGLMSWFLSIGGVILNISIILTMNIKAVYEATPAINDVWIIIRNISSIFIIFALLYTSILTILDQGGTKIGALVKNIVIAGLLINFSLFFTKVLIDTSNLVSLQFYRAIAPTSRTIDITKDDLPSLFKNIFSSGGLSDVFMQSLQIQKVYDVKSQKNLLQQDSLGGAMFKIFVSTVAGSAIMFFAALSFMAAAIAFTVRLVILLLLMGFSPIYFVGIIFPDVKKDISDKWWGWLKQQLIFMPVYLLFMYVALRFISTINPKEGFFTALNLAQKDASGVSQYGILLSNVGIIFQYGIALILINIPLLAASQIGGGLSTKWGESAQKWVSGKLRQGAGATSSYAGRNTVGRWAGNLDKKWENTPRGNSRIGRSLREATTGKMANSKFGGSTSFKDDEKLDKEIDSKRREIDNVRNIKGYIETLKKNPADIAAQKGIRDAMNKMSNKEIESLDKDILSSEHVVPHVSSNVYKNIEKGDKSDSDKVAIRDARNKKLAVAVGSGSSSTIKDILKNMSGEDLQRYIEDTTPPGTPISDNLIEHIRSSQLKDMDGMDSTLRKQIGNSIDLWTGKYPNNHAAYKFINDNRGEWT